MNEDEKICNIFRKHINENKIFSAEIAKAIGEDVFLVDEVIREYSQRSNSFINGLFP